MSQEEFQDVQRLIALKRFEQPPEGFVDDFLDEFHSRQRSELLQKSSRGLFWERLSTYIGEFGAAKWAYASVGACALFLGLFAAGTQFGGQGNSTLPTTALFPESSSLPNGNGNAPALPRMGGAIPAGTAPVSSSMSGFASPHFGPAGGVVPVGATRNAEGRVIVYREF